jgi:hypothetical protein
MSSLSTFEEASTAIARLDLSFGGEFVTERQKFNELRLFRNADPSHVQAAVARAVRYFSRRPNTDELNQMLRDEKLGRVPVDPEDITPATLIGIEVDRIRERLAGDEVVILTSSDRVVVAKVRDPNGPVVDVRWTAAFGWTCSCPDLACAHSAAVKALTVETVA